MTETTEKKKRGPGRPKGSKPITQDTAAVIDTPVTPVATAEVQGTTNADTRLLQLEAQISLLTSALLAERQQVPVSEDDATIGVMKIGGPNLSVFLTDAYGRKRHFLWEKDQEVLYLTPAQYEEAMTGFAAKFFERGFLALEDDVATDLALIDPERFIMGFDLNDIDEYFREVDDPAVMLRLVNYIDTKRVITEDDKGRPLTDDDGNPRAEVVALNPHYRMVADACVTRLYAITGVRYSLLDG